ncbi:MAG: ROK family protein [Elusimicrobia bacterium]|nr:ROK family protein [Elusimicrobiota bacterium]
MAKDLFVGVDIGGTKIAAALVSGRGKILARGKETTPRGVGPKRIVKAVEALIKAVVAEGGYRLKDVRGVGIGAPGLVDPEGRKILAAPNIKLAGFPVVAWLEKRLGADVVMGNDVNVGVMGEQWLGAGKGAQNVVGLFPGTGVGGGVIADGRLLLGAHGAAAELGHIVVDPKGPLCGCGNRGCLEALASRTAIERDIRAAIAKGQRSVVSELTNGKLGVIKSKVLAKALKRKDAVVTRVMRSAAEALGAACVDLRHVFDPERIILGGGVIEACGDFILPIVQKRIDRDPFFKKVGACEAVPSQLGDDAVILGGVALTKRL